MERWTTLTENTDIVDSALGKLRSNYEDNEISFLIPQSKPYYGRLGGVNVSKLQVVLTSEVLNDISSTNC
jgi:hypothetical protein